jgi:hypothetical protein
VVALKNKTNYNKIRVSLMLRKRAIIPYLI